MKNLIPHSFFLLAMLCSVMSFCAFAQPSSVDVKTFLSGTKYAIIDLTQKEQDLVDAQKHPIIPVFAKYLKSLGFQKVVFTTTDKTQLMLQVPTLCEVAKVRLDMVFVKGIYTHSAIQFSSCIEGKEFSLKQDNYIPSDENVLANLIAAWQNLYNQPIGYNPLNVLKLQKGPSVMDEVTAKRILTNSNYPHDLIEGIYEKTVTYGYARQQHKIAILRLESHLYSIFYLDGISNDQDWNEGEKMGWLPVSPSDILYHNVHWETNNRVMNSDGTINFSDANNFSLSFSKHSYQYDYKRVDIGNLTAKATVIDYEKNVINKLNEPIGVEKNLSNNYYLSSTGSAVAISSDGYIVTNYHVVADQELLELMIPNQDTQTAYRARVVSVDKSADLALLKIEDYKFNGLPRIPYYFKYEEAEVGEKVFAMGFPMVGTMGFDIKLTDGLISSRKGYQDDPKTHQISVPVNPGNSGGPLFNENGELVGIIKAKHSNADNASYAVKTANIVTLLRDGNVHISLPKNNSLRGKDMTEQVRDLEPFVFWVRAFKTK